MVGIEEHDREHQEILETIQAMRSALLAKGTAATKRRIVRAALDSVVTYMRNHFAVEENLMRESAYPAYLNHKEEHKSFLKKVEVMQGKMHVVSMMPSIESLNMLCNWLHHHVLESDKPLVPHLMNTVLLHHSPHGGEKKGSAAVVPTKKEVGRSPLDEPKDYQEGAIK